MKVVDSSTCVQQMGGTCVSSRVTDAADGWWCSAVAVIAQWYPDVEGGQAGMVRGAVRWPFK